MHAAPCRVLLAVEALRSHVLKHSVTSGRASAVLDSRAACMPSQGGVVVFGGCAVSSLWRRRRAAATPVRDA